MKGISRQDINHDREISRSLPSSAMCIHKYFIFKQCGHSYFAPQPLKLCAARIAQNEAKYTTPKKSRSKRSKSEAATVPPTSCIPTAHPYRTLIIHSGLCLHCELRRAQALAIAESNIQIATYPERKWRVRYSVPQKSGLEGAFPEGGWANGSDLDVNGFVRREEEARRSKKAEEMRRKEVEGAQELRSPASASSWKTSHRHVDDDAANTRSGSFGSFGARRL